MQITRYELAGLKCVEVAPANAQNSADLPIVVMLHGLGDWGESYIDFAPALSETAYRFVFPTAPIPLQGALYQWFVFEPSHFLQGVMQARQRIIELLEALSARYQVPTSRIVLSGFSQGAMLTLDVGLHYKDSQGFALGGLAALSGMLVVDSTQAIDFTRGDFSRYYTNTTAETTQELQAAAMGKLPILLIHGTRDLVVPVSAARESVKLLREAGLTLNYTEFKYAHEITLDTLALIKQFLAETLS